MPDDPPTPYPPGNPARRGGTGLAGETTRNADSTILPAANPRPLEFIGDFEVMSKLGQGGMGAVYRARQVSLDREVALKILPANFEADADYVSRFEREGRVAASLSHANLVKVYAAGVADGCHYIAMELVEGETLGQWVKRGALPPLEALRIILDVARALECGWRTAHLIHRDIKPGNIFLSTEGAVKLGDLGLAKIIGGDSTTGLTQTGTAMGTPHYISPEQARGDRDLDFRADIYSLGCTLYQMLTKQTPYSGSEPMVVMNQHITAAPPAILKVMPQCPLPLARLVSKMLKKQRRERPASYEELIAAIESVRAQLDPSLAAPAPLPPAAEADETPKVGMDRRAIPDQGTLGERSLPGKSRRPRTVAIAAGVLVLAAVVYFLWPKPEKLTKAQIYARDHASEPSASAETAGGTRSGASQTSGDQGRPGARPFESTPAAEPWQDVLHDPVQLVLSGGAERTPEGLRFTNGGFAMLGPSQGPKRDGALRMRATFGGLNSHLRARQTESGDAYKLNAAADGKSVILWRWHSGANLSTSLRRFPLSEQLKPGQDYELELRVVGQTLTAAFNGEVLGTVTDGTYTEGEFGVAASRGNDATPALVKALEVLDLDAPAGAPQTSGDQGRAGAHPSDATKDAPFVNGLGMKFVPVPIIGGPTGGQRVLFSVWDTRVQDYGAFATETKQEWPKAEFDQGPTHPAVRVSWEDAQLFCQWLTERERKAGKLGANEVYRLPSDHEWSCAVGIGDKEDAAKLPAEKNQKIFDVLPWGTQWPPPENAGNYWSEELRPQFAAGKYYWIKGELTGRHDGYANTSPVGSFPANTLGLYDIGGNAWQWCEDWYDNDHKTRVQRGASWMGSDRGALVSSFRAHNAPTARFSENGFRCVVGASTR